MDYRRRMDKFWAGSQWSPSMKDWPWASNTGNTHVQQQQVSDNHHLHHHHLHSQQQQVAMENHHHDHHHHRCSCNSPSSSEISSSSLSTQYDTSSFSGKSHDSSSMNAEKTALPGAMPPSGFSLFNPSFNNFDPKVLSDSLQLLQVSGGTKEKQYLPQHEANVISPDRNMLTYSEPECSSSTSCYSKYPRKYSNISNHRSDDAANERAVETDEGDVDSLYCDARSSTSSSSPTYTNDRKNPSINVGIVQRLKTQYEQNILGIGIISPGGRSLDESVSSSKSDHWRHDRTTAAASSRQRQRQPSPKTQGSCRNECQALESFFEDEVAAGGHHGSYFQSSASMSSTEVLYHASVQRLNGHVLNELPLMENVNKAMAPNNHHDFANSPSKKCSSRPTQKPDLGNDRIYKSDTECCQTGKTQPPLPTARQNRKSRHSVAVKNRYSPTSFHGYLRIAEQDGSPCFSFFVSDSDEVLFARACSNSERKSGRSTWLYTFHSRRDSGKLGIKSAWRTSPRREKPPAVASDLVGKMKLSNAHGAHSSQKQSRFVLVGNFAADEEDPISESSHKQLQKYLMKSSNSVSASAASSTRISISKHIKLLASDEPQCLNLQENHWIHDHVRSQLKTTTATTSPTQHNDIHDIELAAIVITTSLKERTPRAAATPTRPKKASLDHGYLGWGVRFLEKCSRNGWGLNLIKSSSGDRLSSQRSRIHSDEIEDQSIASNHNKAQDDMENDEFSSISSQSERNRKVKIDMTVILPAGYHGFPLDGYNGTGPNPLIDRWRSGGDCDCGGWDMGCGLSVLKSESLIIQKSEPVMALTSHDLMRWLSPGHPLKIMTQDSNQKKVLVLEMIQPGLFSLRFHSRFSPLQAFATVVAIFHQQIAQK